MRSSIKPNYDGERAWNDPGSVDPRFRGLIQRHGLTQRNKTCGTWFSYGPRPQTTLLQGLELPRARPGVGGRGSRSACGAGAGTLWSNSVGGMLDRYTSDQFFRHVTRR